MFEKSLTDLIQGLRANRRSEARYVASCIDECRQELSSTDLDLKTQAVLKISYLQMLGYSMDWASFHILEVMSQPRLRAKRLGYLAASLSFTRDTSVLMLATNLLQKDISSNDPVNVSVALNTLADIATPDLARDLSPHMQPLLSHPDIRLRKRASITMYKCCLQHPELLDPFFPLLCQNLEDTDQGVVGVVVNVVCELAKKYPSLCLPLAPPLFRLLVTSSNNWMLIKIVKLFGALVEREPRLVKKLASPLRQLLETTPALSLMHECVQTILAAERDRRELAEICVEKLRLLLENEDPNLKYVAMLTMAQMLQRYPRLVSMHHDIIVSCLDDPDLSIRTRALDLLLAMVRCVSLK
ncbi:Clathrin/coatomer adaptor, adaptin-like protein [Piptocephalis cylindrospora]|uniref:Clathrin/coatomer adaptor, adaptin-like protein n=1 Tax=Piptocephalis cylindrospora TaxID=1907219 RepID=A0A4P9XZI7_9FUNG|nr:Clathrin/coatomer adaptor, adaptin-like protein [Piptocephalis cylindrospora]|eukprot:RKP11855.1 Clathrin/coatomer adaptor, adaptin-like protein [Piptocephalis cylindrospora]